MLAYAICTNHNLVMLYARNLAQNGTADDSFQRLTTQNVRVCGIAWTLDQRALLYDSG